MVYTIGETARILRIPASTLRFYDKQGLLPFVERSESGIRVFKEVDIERLRLIECLKRSGLRLSEVREFLEMAMEGDSTIEARLNIFKRRREDIMKQLETLEDTLAVVNYKCWFYETALKNGTTRSVDAMPDDELPPDMAAIRRRMCGKCHNGAEHGETGERRAL